MGERLSTGASEVGVAERALRRLRAEQPPAPGLEAPRRILIVDDEEGILFALESYFGTAGFQVDCARELEEAEALLAHSAYAVVISDLRLTGTHGAEGLEVLSFIRERCPWTKAILLTAHGSPDLEREARERGVGLMLNKPQSLPDLARAVLALLAAGQ